MLLTKRIVLMRSAFAEPNFSPLLSGGIPRFIKAE